MDTTPSIAPIPNGPLVFKDPRTMVACSSLTDVAGSPIPNQPYVALCRCGGSKNKPFCDGSHLGNGFRSEKSPDRVRDRRRDYAGDGIVVHDNRGVCAHAGLCTEGLPAVFREDAKPWIDATKADPKAIGEVVRRCPSGALNLSIGGREQIAQRDPVRPPRVAVRPDGPYEVEGGVRLLGAEFGEGASQEHYCLCRCGASKNKPFCDGTHEDVGFRG